MTPGRFNLVSQVGRVPSMTVPLDLRQESRFQRLMEESIMIDLHQHPMVLPEDVSQYWEYLRSDSYVWGGMTRFGKAALPLSEQPTYFAGCFTPTRCPSSGFPTCWTRSR